MSIKTRQSSPIQGWTETTECRGMKTLNLAKVTAFVGTRVVRIKRCTGVRLAADRVAARKMAP